MDALTTSLSHTLGAQLPNILGALGILIVGYVWLFRKRALEWV